MYKNLNKMELFFCNLIFRGLRKNEILEKSLSEFVHVVTLSAESIATANKIPKLKNIVNSNWATLDGHISYKIAKLRNKAIDFEKISGSDFIYDICLFAQKQKWKIFLLGGKDFSNTESVKRLKGEYGLEAKGRVTGIIAYPFSKETIESIQKDIKEFSPDVIVVALGVPKQEYWIDENRNFLIQNNVKLAIGCGGTLECFSGMIKRAPIFIQKIGLEILYRFVKEPNWYRFKRLLKAFLMFKYI
jgi:N-acetylglucosaminyldiphosphoundecaprenol N-acetyl-beta-D-mannosaminyltransferase